MVLPLTSYYKLVEYIYIQLKAVGNPSSTLCKWIQANGVFQAETPRTNNGDF